MTRDLSSHRGMSRKRHRTRAASFDSSTANGRGPHFPFTAVRPMPRSSTRDWSPPHEEPERLDRPVKVRPLRHPPWLRRGG